MRSACLLLVALVPVATAADPTPEQAEFFEKKVRPVPPPIRSTASSTPNSASRASIPSARPTGGR